MERLFERLLLRDAWPTLAGSFIVHLCEPGVDSQLQLEHGASRRLDYASQSYEAVRPALNISKVRLLLDFSSIMLSCYKAARAKVHLSAIILPWTTSTTSFRLHPSSLTLLLFPFILSLWESFHLFQRQPLKQYIRPRRSLVPPFGAALLETGNVSWKFRYPHALSRYGSPDFRSRSSSTFCSSLRPVRDLRTLCK